MINSPERSLKRKSIFIPSSPIILANYKNIEILTRILDKLVNDFSPKLKSLIEFKKLIAKLKSLSKYSYINKDNKHLLYRDIDALKYQSFSSASLNNLNQFLINLFNKLQNNIEQLPESKKNEKDIEAAKSYCEKFYREMDFQVYWGGPRNFIEELVERWKNFYK